MYSNGSSNVGVVEMSEAKPVKKTYLELLAESQAIAKLAEDARIEELEPVIAMMKSDIAAYQIKAEQLASGASSSNTTRTKAPAPAPSQTYKAY